MQSDKNSPEALNKDDNPKQTPPTSVDGEKGVPLVSFLESALVSTPPPPPPPSVASNSREVIDTFFGVMSRSSSDLVSLVGTSESGGGGGLPDGLNMPDRDFSGVRGDWAPEGVGDVPCVPA